MPKVTRLEQEMQVLRHELAIVRFDRDELYRKHGSHFKRCAGGDCCKKFRLDDETDTKSKNRDTYIAYLEDQIKQTRLKYHKQMGDVKTSAVMLETNLQNVRDEMSCITARVRQVEKLKKNVEVLKSKLQRRDSIIAQYGGKHTINDIVKTVNNNEDQQPIGKDIANNRLESEGCRGDRRDSKFVSTNRTGSKKNFVCLSAALKKKVSQH